MMQSAYVRATGLGVAGRLSEVSFEWPRGSTVAILGPSGSGKTTLLRLIAGFEAPEQGQIEIGGELKSAPRRLLQPPEARRLAFAFQEPALMPHMDVAENVCLGRRGSAVDRLALARKALVEVGLEHFEQRRIWQLSGGEAQRVQLARILAADADMLLLDEPFASVDRLCRADLLTRIGGKLKRGGGRGCVALVTHDPADARELADLVILLRDGRIVAFGEFTAIASGACGPWPAQFLNAGLV